MYDTNRELVVSQSEICVAVLGEGCEFVLIRIDGEIDNAATEAAVARGLGYCGCLGIKDGRAAAHCEPDFGSAFTMMLAAIAFCQQMAEKLKQKKTGDSAEWLERLFGLPDTRN
jgi:hypothetical protein